MTRARALSAAILLGLAAAPASAQNQLWIKQFGTALSDRADAAAPDGSGGLYLGGQTNGSLAGPSAGNTDAWLARHDSAGNQIWIRQLGSVADDRAWAAASDGSGGAYSTGLTLGTLGGPSAGGIDTWVARYDGSGNQMWIRQLGTSLDDGPRGAAPDGSGGVYVSGYTQGSLGGPFAGQYDAWVARYDAAGNQLWIRQLGSFGFESSFAAAADGSGGVYLSGGTDGILGGPALGYMDAWLARYDSAGNLMWLRQFGTDQPDFANAAAMDGAGGVHVGGSTYGDLGGPNAGADDAWLARYDSAGNQLWARQLGTSANDTAFGASLDGAGGVHISGQTAGSLAGPFAGGPTDAWFARYDSAGNKFWVRQLGTSGTDFANAAAPDGSGGVLVAGGTGGSLGGQSAGVLDAWLARYDGSCGVGGSYCTASTTSIPGCQASIGADGAPSLSNPSSFTITSGSVPGGNLGICFFGNSGAASIPFGTLGGQICVKPPVFRSSVKSSGATQGACNGAFTFTLQDLIDAAPIVVAGAVINVEIWARDPANPDGFLLSNGLELTVCP